MTERLFNICYVKRRFTQIYNDFSFISDLGNRFKSFLINLVSLSYIVLILVWRSNKLATRLDEHQHSRFVYTIRLGQYTY